MNKITPEELAYWQWLADNATPGPWKAEDRDGENTENRPDYDSDMRDFYGWRVEGPEDALRGQFQSGFDACLMAAAREAIPRLLQELRALGYEDDLILPAFDTVEQANEFWERHDLYEFLHRFKPSTLKLPPTSSYTMTVPMDPSVSDLLYQLAQELGVDYTMLAGDWIVERLQTELAARDQRK